MASRRKISRSEAGKVADGKKKLHIKWIRSGIGFPKRQKEMVRSLGLARLNHVVERPDTAQIRGLVARIPHLVEVTEVAPAPSWKAVPEYTVHEAKPEERVKAPKAAKPAAESAEAKPEVAVEAPKPVEEPKAHKAKAAAKKHAAPETKETKKAAAKTAKKAAPAKKTKAAASKDSKTIKKGKK